MYGKSIGNKAIQFTGYEHATACSLKFDLTPTVYVSLYSWFEIQI